MGFTKTRQEVIEMSELLANQVDVYINILYELKLIADVDKIDCRYIDILLKIKKAYDPLDKKEEIWKKQCYIQLFIEVPFEIYQVPNYKIDSSLILKDFLWHYNRGDYKKEYGLSREEENHIFLDVLIESFYYMGLSNSAFTGSSIGDINARCVIMVGKSDSYYIIGKLNHYNMAEEIHVFYCPEPKFNIMRIRYVGGGPKENDIMSQFESIWN